jgi:hypothetical protein
LIVVVDDEDFGGHVLTDRVPLAEIAVHDDSHRILLT